MTAARARTLVAINPTAMTSGAERVLLDHLVHLQELGWSVTLRSPDGPLHGAARSSQVPWVELPDMKLPDGDKVRAAGRMGQAWIQAARALRAAAADADVVLTNGLMALPALRLARLTAPVVWLVHDVIVRRDLQLLVRASAGAVDHAVAVSECSAEFPRACGIETSVLLNGTVWPVPRAPVTMPTPPIVGVSAVLTPWKGHDVLLEAAALTRPEITYEVMGGTPPKDAAWGAQLRARAAQPDLAGRVHFLGHVSDPRARLRTWSLAVSPSVDPEACPLNVLEAMSLGVPMVVTDHGGAAEVIRDAGIRVPVRDPAALASGIESLLDDADEHRRMRLRGPEIIEAHHQLGDVSRRFAEVIETVM